MIRNPMPVTQFNMKWVEQAGGEVDFRLKTLTVADRGALVKRRGIEIDHGNPARR